jgi:hypothetical protein
MEDPSINDKEVKPALQRASTATRAQANSAAPMAESAIVA